MSIFGFQIPSTGRKYESLVAEVAKLASNTDARDKLKKQALNISTVAWEDTSRTKNSCWGKNISDLTLKVGSTRMPIIRADNFTDNSVDLPMDKLPMLVVGNETGTSLKKITLKEYLENFHLYCGSVDSRFSLYNKRDEMVLTSAQACVLPSDNGKVEFAVDLYNYQSSHSEPAVLVIMATAYGTSAQVVCGGNTLLYFNNNGTSRTFTAERLSDHRASEGKPTTGPMTSEEKALNGIYIFQVPLKYTPRAMPMMECLSFCSMTTMEDCCAPKSMAMANSRGMERAVLKLGEEKGKYKGIRDSNGKAHKLERDDSMPIRLTVQFYMCTDSSSITDSNVEEICTQIRRIYDQGCNEGSLVVDAKVPKTGLPVEPTPSRPTATTPAPHLDNSIL